MVREKDVRGELKNDLLALDDSLGNMAQRCIGAVELVISPPRSRTCHPTERFNLDLDCVCLVSRRPAVVR
jgi:hypothetical protein